MMVVSVLGREIITCRGWEVLQTRPVLLDHWQGSCTSQAAVAVLWENRWRYWQGAVALRASCQVA